MDDSSSKFTLFIYLVSNNDTIKGEGLVNARLSKKVFAGKFNQSLEIHIQMIKSRHGGGTAFQKSTPNNQ